MTKGEMTKILKRFGIRQGDKNGALVTLEHLKFEDVCKLFADFENFFNPETDIVCGTGDAVVWKGKI